MCGDLLHGVLDLMFLCALDTIRSVGFGIWGTIF